MGKRGKSCTISIYKYHENRFKSVQENLCLKPQSWREGCVEMNNKCYLRKGLVYALAPVAIKKDSRNK